MRRPLLLGVLALSACSHHFVEAPRVLRVLVAADAKFRQHSHWRDVITSRIHNVSARFDSAFGIRFELAGVSEWDPDRQLPPALKRRQLGGTNPDGNLVLLGFTEPADGSPEPGLALALDPRLLVFDFPAKPEEQNETILAHELAHVFGAWHSGEGNSILHLPPGTSFDSTTQEAIGLTRLAELGAGSPGLSREMAHRFTELFARSKSDPASNPLFQAYLFKGHELLNTGHEEAGIEPLSRAIELAPRDTNAHYMLGRADLFAKRFADAAFEFRKVVEIDPRHVPGWNSLGGSLLQLGQPEPALAAFRKALEIEPSNRTIRANMGAARVRMPGELDRGIAELQEILREDPNQKDAEGALKAALEFKQKGAPGGGREPPEKPAPQAKPLPVPR
jgi:Flp pilus assembly protein TadD